MRLSLWWILGAASKHTITQIQACSSSTQLKRCHSAAKKSWYLRTQIVMLTILSTCSTIRAWSHKSRIRTQNFSRQILDSNNHINRENNSAQNSHNNFLFPRHQPLKPFNFSLTFSGNWCKLMKRVPNHSKHLTVYHRILQSIPLQCSSLRSSSNSGPKSLTIWTSVRMSKNWSNCGSKIWTPTLASWRWPMRTRSHRHQFKSQAN